MGSCSIYCISLKYLAITQSSSAILKLQVNMSQVITNPYCWRNRADCTVHNYSHWSFFTLCLLLSFMSKWSWRLFAMSRKRSFLCIHAHAEMNLHFTLYNYANGFTSRKIWWMKTGSQHVPAVLWILSSYAQLYFFWNSWYFIDRMNWKNTFSLTKLTALCVDRN